MSGAKRADPDLLDAWRGGDTQAGDELLRKHFVSVYRFFDANLSNAHSGGDAEDLTQKTFEACIAGRDRVRTDFRAYLFGIARRQLMREWERRRARGEVVTPSQAGIRDVRTSPSAAVARLDVQQLFLRSLELLPLEFKAALELFYWEDRSIPEIAEELGIAKGTVKSRLFRGKAMLKDRLIALGIPAELRNSTVELIEQRSKELNLGDDPETKA
ncbi:MAG: RNA polymerase sigma factor [Nannocystaceae bacterium]|nr:RNA polymerase sigma factor [bacterium]